MTIEEIASYCEFKNCTVACGDPESGFIQLDGNGVSSSFNAYRRFLALNEMASLPRPSSVLDGATIFRVCRAAAERQLSRAEFEEELKRFQQLVS